VLLDTYIPLSSGARVRLRLPHGRDPLGVIALLTRLGLGVDELDARRLLRFDPQARAVLCATLWTPGGEVLVGVGAVTYSTQLIDLLVTDEHIAPGLAGALHGVLATGAASRRAA
jgi:hypothetical protein